MDSFSEQHAIQGLDPNSYTAHRLKHASPTHLHLTTRRCFVGPIPIGWLKSHRNTWYTTIIHSDYSSHAATFTASGVVSDHRAVTGLGSSNRQSFPQPRGLDLGASRSVGDDREDVAGKSFKADDEELNGHASEDEDEEQLENEELTRIEEYPEPIASLDGTRENTLGRSNRKQRLKARFRTPKVRPLSRRKKSTSSSLGSSSFMTAREYASPPRTAVSNNHLAPTKQADVSRSFSNGASTATSESVTSASLLLPHMQATPKSVPQLDGTNLDDLTSFHDAGDGTKTPKRREISRIQSRGERSLVQVNPEVMMEGEDEPACEVTNFASVHFNIPEDVPKRLHSEIDEVRRKATLRIWKRGKVQEGEIIRVSKMLVQVEVTRHSLAEDYDENDSLRIDTQIMEKWREFIVVCRQGAKDETELFLQLYKSRVIPAIDKERVQKRPAYEIPLSRKTTNVNFFSSLDKSVVVWTTKGKLTQIFILKPKSTTYAAEWYTFLKDALGWKRPSTLKVNVPDLSIQLHLTNPFAGLENESRKMVTSGDSSSALTVNRQLCEGGVAQRIVEQCMSMLQGSPEWASVLDTWSRTERMGLAWKRYDRIEWIHGANESKMFGTMAMLKSYDLELRPKLHYPTVVRLPKTGEHIQEAPPVEGFLIRLTSQRGRGRRLGKMFYKRLYFTTQDQYLCFGRPARVVPPPPPELPSSNRISSIITVVEQTPLIYAVRPYLTDDDNKISWLRSGAVQTIRKKDREAADEAERNRKNMLHCDGFIDLCNVAKVRPMLKGTHAADEGIDEMPDVDFHDETPTGDATSRNEGSTKVNEDQTFEIVLRNKLVIRLQAYNKATMEEWVNRLRALVKYWKLRKSADIQILKSVRQANLTQLHIDEETESQIGQFAQKWEVSKSFASPRMFNMCGYSDCRTIRLSGLLYHKPRRHTAFTQCVAVLCDGQLIMFQDSLRSRTGALIRCTHQERQQSLDLQNCYIYSGLITDNDLLYHNQTFDANNPGHHALPRMFTGDGWTSVDEDTMSCFVIWHSLRKSFFKAEEQDESGQTQNRLRVVSKLGVSGRTIVFKCRSRIERDLWVTAISSEIERLQGAEEVRVIPGK